MQDKTFNKEGATVVDIKLGRRTFDDPAEHVHSNVVDDEHARKDEAAIKGLNTPNPKYVTSGKKLFGIDFTDKLTKKNKMSLRNVMTSTLGNVPNEEEWQYTNEQNKDPKIPYDSFGAGCRIDVMYNFCFRIENSKYELPFEQKILFFRA